MPLSKPFEAPAADGWQSFLERARGILLQKLWLPRGVYESLPFIYIILGLVALGSAFFMPGWVWILPYAVLMGLICLHAGLIIVALRYRFRRSSRTRTENTKNTSAQT
jgi:hypothetical protein